MLDSAIYLAEHLHEVPVHVIPCIEGRVENAGVLAQASVYGSILPAAWSFMLAARARGLGIGVDDAAPRARGGDRRSCSSIPATVTQTALLPVAYFKGSDFKQATRLPARELTSWNRWGSRA